MHTKLINLILLAFFLLHTTGYAKLNEPTIASSENCKTDLNDELLKQDVFLCELSDFNIPFKQSLNIPDNHQFKKIIIKVTGQQPSRLQGQWQELAQWNIGDAELYLLNSNGIILDDFKPQFNIANNLYFSTAQHFSVQNAQFEFKKIPQPIEIINSKLKFKPNKNIALLGGEITTLDSTFILPDGDIYMIAANSTGYVKIDKPYQYFFNELADIKISRKIARFHDKSKATYKMGNGVCELIDNKYESKADIDLTGQAGGLAFLRANNLILDNGWIFSDTKCALDGKGINIEVNHNLELKRAGRITTDAMDNSTGKGGYINLKAGNKIILDSYTFEAYKHKEKVKNSDDYNFDQMFSSVTTNIYGAGQGGNIIIEAKKLIMRNRASIQAALSGISSGDGGSVDIDTEQSIELENYSQLNMFAVKGSSGNIGNLELKTQFLKLEDSVIRLQNKGAGNGGSLSITAQNMDIFNTDKNLAWIRQDCGGLNMNNTTVKNTDSSRPQASILGFVKESAQKASNVKIDIAQDLKLSEGAYIDTSSLNQVKGGDVVISAKNITLTGKTCPSRIISAALNEGNGGNIELILKDKLLIKKGSAIIANSYTEKLVKTKNQENELSFHIESEIKSEQIQEFGVGGNIKITGKHLVIDNNSRITVKSSNQQKAGNISLVFDDIKLQKQSCITASSEKTGGGNIKIKLKQQLNLSNNSEMTASTSGLEQYSGGNIDINKDMEAAETIILDDESNINAKAYKGRGGNIHIKTKRLLKSVASKIDASSELGIDGTVRIEELETGFAQQFIPQTLSFENPKSISFRACSKQEQNKLFILEQEFLTSHPFAINMPVPKIDKTAENNNQVQNPAKNYNLYAQNLKHKFDIKKIIPVGKTHFLKEIIDIIGKPEQTSRYDLMMIQDKIQAMYDKHYNAQLSEFDKNNRGQIYSTHNTVRIPNQNIDDGIIEIQITEEQLTHIQFIDEAQKNTPFHPNFIRSRLIPSSIFRTQELHQSLQKLLERGIIEKFNARLQTGQKSSEKILYINMLKGVEFKPTEKQGITEYHNQLCWGDYAYKMLRDDLKKRYQDLILNRTDTRLESSKTYSKFQQYDLDVKSDNYLYKIALNQPIYENYARSDSNTRFKEEMSLNFQLKKQHLKINLKQRLFNMFVGMLDGQKRQYSYAIEQQWLKTYEDSRSEQINARFEFAIKAINQANIFNYQRNKHYNANIQWNFDFQLANQHSTFLNSFALKKDKAIRGYSENRFLDNNGVSSRFTLQLFGDAEKSKWLSIQWFFDMGAVWNTNELDTELVKILWNQKKQQLASSFKTYQSTDKTQEYPQYVKQLRQSIWNKPALSQLSEVLQNHWQQTQEICNDVFNMDKLAYKELENGKRCNLPFLVSTGIEFNGTLFDMPINWIFAQTLFR
ncbi:MAG: hypothetical protein VSS52_007135 [Thiotrichaceae bacterium]|nr:hypothetical protein [Thiotrichaceae bacterium]